MKRLGLSVLLCLGVVAALPTQVLAYNYGDYRSETLVSRAWESLNKADIEGVLAYTNKAIELYGEQARDMQNGLKEFPSGEKEKVFAFWALNDIGTAYFIQGEAFRKAEMMEEAKQAYNKVIREFAFAQSWDNGGFFWKPAEAAKEKLAMLESGMDIDFGDMSSSTLVSKAWKALSKNDVKAVEIYANKAIDLYASKAKEMQKGLDDYVWESNDKIASYWALNDIGTAYYILGDAYAKAGRKDDALKALKTLVDEFFYAQTWDPQGWYWKPAEAAQQKLVQLES